MKKLNVLFMIFLLGVLSCDFSSQEELPEMQDALLWKISGNELAEPSYLFGSFNGIPGSFLDSVAGFKNVFKSVKQVAMRIDASYNSSARKMSSNVQMISSNSSGTTSLMPADTTYMMLYNSKNYAFVDSALKSQLVKYSINYYQLRPYVISGEYISSIRFLQESLEGNNSLDFAIMNQAKNASLKIIDLESVSEKIDNKFMSYNSLPKFGEGLKDQALSLLFLIKTQLVFKNVKLRIDSTYRQQTPGEFYLPINDGVTEIDQILSELPDFSMKQAYGDSIVKQLNYFLGYKTDQMNNLWMKKILSAIKKQPTLISVGALHLIGENGLINQLRQYGYTVEPVLSDGDYD